MATDTSPPYARMIGSTFDVSVYCQQSLIDALDHLSSIRFVLYTLIRPALTIAARSLFDEDETLTISSLLLHLNQDTTIASSLTNAGLQKPKRSLLERIIYFFTIGLPLAIIVGLLVGVINFVKAVTTDIITLLTVSIHLYSMSQCDMKFYGENPQLLPSRNAAIDGVIHGGLSFYTHRFVYKKLGIFSFVAQPFMNLIEPMLINKLIHFFDQIDQMRTYDDSQTKPLLPSVYSNK